jgi:hypothetical protein
MAGEDTLCFFRTCHAGETVLWLFAGIVLGWNGVQFLLSDYFIYLFVDRFSISMFSYRLLHGKMPAMLYILIAATPIVLWIFRVIAEASLLRCIRRDTPLPGDTHPLRFGLNALFVGGGVTLTLTAVFLLPYAVHWRFHLYSPDYANGLRFSFVFAVIESVLLWGVVSTFLIDFVLPLMSRGFASATSEAYRRLHHYLPEYILIYFVRIVSVIISVIIGIAILRLLLFPLGVWIGNELGHTPFKSFDLYLGRWGYNYWQIAVTAIFVLMCASPVYLPFYVFQRYLIRRVFANRYLEY